VPGSTASASSNSNLAIKKPSCPSRGSKRCTSAHCSTISPHPSRSDALSRTQKHSDALSRNQTHSDALGRTQTHSDALRRTQTHSDALGRTRAHAGEPHLLSMREAISGGNQRPSARSHLLRRQSAPETTARS
jgi:hypothetical protein